MALFTDGLCTNLDDLPKYDASVLSVASTERIDVASKLEMAQELLSGELRSLLGAENLEKVVVTPALRAAHAYGALEQVYRDAYNSQLNDRYEGRWRQFERLRRESWRNVVEGGIGLVDEPIRRAGLPEVGSAPGTDGGGVYYVRVTWVNSRGEEGVPSDAALAIIEPGSALTVRAPNHPPHSTGWNVYAGGAPEECTRQNSATIPNEAQWVQTAPIAAEGPRPGNGQVPGYVRAVPRLLQRG
jgi:hypothetical protein